MSTTVYDAASQVIASGRSAGISLHAELRPRRQSDDGDGRQRHRHDEPLFLQLEPTSGVSSTAWAWPRASSTTSPGNRSRFRTRGGSSPRRATTGPGAPSRSWTRSASVSTMGYDGAGRQVSSTDPLGRTSHDGFRRRKSRRRGRDADGIRLRRPSTTPRAERSPRIDPLGNIATTVFDAEARPWPTKTP